jgi:hypothetical protein
VEQNKKIDWEIPRKVLHSSIGEFLLTVRSTSKSHLYMQGSSHCTYMFTKLTPRSSCSFFGLHWPFSSPLISFAYDTLVLSGHSSGVLAFSCAKVKRFVSVATFISFPLTLLSQKSTNGILWYILGVNFVLTFYPTDVAIVSVLMCVLSALQSLNFTNDAPSTVSLGPTQQHPPLAASLAQGHHVSLHVSPSSAYRSRPASRLQGSLRPP